MLKVQTYYYIGNKSEDLKNIFELLNLIYTAIVFEVQTWFKIKKPFALYGDAL